MAENPFEVLGTRMAILRGRARDWDRLMRGLKKPTPSHLSVVGPRFIGKTTLLNAVADHFANDIEGKKWFDACVYWDSRHNTPSDDSAFYQTFARHAADPIKLVDAEIGGELAKPENGNIDAIRFAFESLAQDGKKVLYIMDGLDKVLLEGQITRNLWDSLRSLAELTSLRFLTGSQRRLRELCGSHETKTSDFWEIFDPTPIALSAFSENDWDSILAPFQMRGITFQTGAPKELINWSGGVPVLASAICRSIWDEVRNSDVVSRDQVNSIAGRLRADGLQDILNTLWEDCTEEDRGDLAELAKDQFIRADQISSQRLQMLQSRGYVERDGSVLKLSCRAMKEYALRYGERSTALRRLFGSKPDFEINIKGLLELRFGHLDNADEEMSDFVRLAIQSVDKPHLVVVYIRSLVNRALALIWDSELPSRRIPEDWIHHWEHCGRFPPKDGVVPASPKQQCNLLELMTGEHQAAATKVSRVSYLLLNSLYSVGNFGQHRSETASISFAATVCLSSIELCEQLSIDLFAKSNGD